MDRQWFAPNIQQLSGCELRPDWAQMHCKDYVTNADSIWVRGEDRTTRRLMRIEWFAVVEVARINFAGRS
jgi:hypothetical protein